MTKKKKRGEERRREEKERHDNAVVEMGGFGMCCYPFEISDLRSMIKKTESQ